MSSRLQGWNLLDQETSFLISQEPLQFHAVPSSGRLCVSALLPCFCLMFCKMLMACLVHFVITMICKNGDRSSIHHTVSALKHLSLHNGNMCPSIPVGHMVHTKQTYNTLLSSNWNPCGDWKVLALPVVKQLWHTKCCWFICEWNSCARDLKKDWSCLQAFGTRPKERCIQLGYLASSSLHAWTGEELCQVIEHWGEGVQIL